MMDPGIVASGAMGKEQRPSSARVRTFTFPTCQTQTGLRRRSVDVCRSWTAWEKRSPGEVRCNLSLMSSQSKKRQPGKDLLPSSPVRLENTRLYSHHFSVLSRFSYTEARASGFLVPELLSPVESFQTLNLGAPQLPSTLISAPEPPAFFFLLHI
jgi:hypothetical protein